MENVEFFSDYIAFIGECDRAFVASTVTLEHGEVEKEGSLEGFPEVGKRLHYVALSNGGITLYRSSDQNLIWIRVIESNEYKTSETWSIAKKDSFKANPAVPVSSFRDNLQAALAV